jgi:hypothetical protein
MQVKEMSSLFGWAEYGWNQLLGWIHPFGWAQSRRSVRCEARVPSTLPPPPTGALVLSPIPLSLLPPTLARRRPQLLSFRRAASPSPPLQ